MKKVAVPMCTCHEGSINNTTLKETQINEEGVCKNCGHYAIWVSKYQLYPKARCVGGYMPVVDRHVPGFTVSQLRAYKSGLIYYVDPYGTSLDVDLKELIREE